ncbi:pentapeptide repeat-containing protein [Streptomyces sp. NPDC091281]|uniref:pentapeptide repeat-containing protein n=1 Tax=Streptomyces sp. NPDC091281 TaxID=3365985 RepID=UPI0037F57F9F
MAHLSDSDRCTHLASLEPGADLDHRGTPFTEKLLSDLLSAVRDPITNWPFIGQAQFEEAQFSGHARFDQVKISGDAGFDRVEIRQNASFERVVIGGDARFEQAKIGAHATFARAMIGGNAVFRLANIGGNVEFHLAEVDGDAYFHRATIAANSEFNRVKIEGKADFSRAEIGGHTRFNSAKISSVAEFDRVKFGGDVVFVRAVIGKSARFVWGETGGHADFKWVKIHDDAEFHGIKIRGHVQFSHARIGGTAGFSRVRVEGDADFDRAQIGGPAQFGRSEISGRALFRRAQIGRTAHFGRAKIGGEAKFDGTKIGGDANFQTVVFERTASIGPLICRGTLDLSEAVFGTAVTIEAATSTLRCRRTRWVSTAALRLRHAAVDLSDAVLEYPVSISTRCRTFAVDGEEMTETGFSDPRVRAISLRGVDAAHLVLTDIDLTECLFAGTVHLDQLRLEGKCPLAPVPTGVRWRGWPAHWTPRRTLAEEHHWRASRGSASSGWTSAPDGAEVLEPAALAPVYRQLRKAFEDSKDEPGAADFYYGEMEMRRHDRETPRAERALLSAYWALSGYGLRASRALGWLVAGMLATVFVMMLWGLPQNDPQSNAMGTLTGDSITMTTDTPAPVNPQGPYHDRLSTKRFEKSLRVVINSVVFRSSDQELTTAGTYTEMVSRLTEPVLLGLAALAIRGRVKR